MLPAGLRRGGYCTSLATLRALSGREVCPPLVPKPNALCVSLEGQCRPSIMETGLAAGGVLSGVLLGVDEVLSTLDFLEPDRGVIFELKKVLTGVAMSSLVAKAGASCCVPCGSLRSVGVVDETGDRTFEGVCGPLPIHLEGLVAVEVLVLELRIGRSRVMIATLWR